MCFQQKKYKEYCVDAFRELLDYEFKRNLKFDEQEYLFLVQWILKKIPTAKVLKKLTDEEIMKCVLAPLKFSNGQLPQHMLSNQKQVKLQVCANRQLEERALRQHKACTRCKTTYYCGRDCQVNHWKQHKPTCQQQK
jgi:radical SAM protein with 4Fe4S-binding SPASM domain